MKGVDWTRVLQSVETPAEEHVGVSIKNGHNLVFSVIIEISRQCFCILEVEGAP